MTLPAGHHEQFQELKLSLSTLITEYREARDLMSDQLQAVMYNDLVRLDSLVQDQLSKYEKLEKLETEFKNKLENIFRKYCPEESRHTLTALMEKLEEPSEELNMLRTELREQIEKTQDLRDQLMDLLRFASNYNIRTFEEIFEIQETGSESYSADGQKNSNTFGSVAINQRA